MALNSASPLLKSNVVTADESHVKVNHVPFVKQLTVRKINGINWDQFVKSLYLKDLQTTITGITLFIYQLNIINSNNKKLYFR